MAYTLDEVRYGMRQRGLNGYHPWQGESSNESIHRGAIEVYVLARQLPEMTGNDLAIRCLMIKHVAQLLEMTPMSARRRVLAELSEQCGIDYLNGKDADGNPLPEEHTKIDDRYWSLGPYRG